MRVLFTTVGLPGHFFPLVPLAWACRAAGHDVLVAAPAEFVPTAVRAGLPVCPWPVGDLATVPEDSDLAGTFAWAAGRALPGARSLVDGWRPDLVVSERAEFAGRVAAAGAGVPHAVLHWGIAALPEYREAALDELGLGRLPAPALTLDPWPPSLRGPHAAGHTGIQDLAYNGDALVPEWVHAPRVRPRVCLTLGTLLPRMDDRFDDTVLPLLERLSGLGADLLVAVDDAVAADWPALPDAVTDVGRMPLSPVLGACDAVVHHGGNGTSLTALGAGCPQLVLPELDDQFDNSTAVVHSGAGLRLLPDRVTPDAVARGCAELLGSQRFARRAAEVAAEIAAQPSPAEVVGLLARAAEPRETGRAA